MVITGGAGPMTTAISIRDANDFMRDLVKDPENAKRLLDFSVDCTLKWILIIKNNLIPLRLPPQILQQARIC